MTQYGEVRIVNRQEQGKHTHDLSVGRTVRGFLIGWYHDEGPDKWYAVIEVNELETEDCAT